MPARIESASDSPAAILDEALGAAGEIDDSLQRVSALGEIGAAQSAAGMADRAGQTFAERLALARTVDYSPEFDRSGGYGEKAGVLNDIASNQAAAGFFADAMATAEKIQGPGAKSSALEGIAVCYAEVGRFDDAMTVARRIPTRGVKEETLSEIARAAAKSGHFAEATAAAREIEPRTTKQETLCAIAAAQMEARSAEQARQTFAEAIADVAASKNRDSAMYDLSAIAHAQIEAGLLSEALATTQRIDDAALKASAFSAIAATQAEQGSALQARRSLADAIAAMQAVALPDAKVGLLCRIATIQGQIGDSDQANQTLAEAVAIAGRIRRPDAKVTALCEIATAQAKVGQLPLARATFSKALAMAREVEGDELSKSWVLQGIAVAQAETGLTTEALATAREIEQADAILRTFRGNAMGDAFGANAEAFTAIAAAQAKAGRFADAIATARRIQDARRKALALHEIAAAQVEAGKPDQARQTAGEASEAVLLIADVGEKGDFPVLLSHAQREAGLVAEALVTGRLIESPDSRAVALGWGAVAQAERGQTEDARKTANEVLTAAQVVEDAEEKASDLGIVALAQAKAGLEDQARRTFSEALATAETIGYPDFCDNGGRLSPLAEIASEQLDEGHLAEAIASARDVKYPGTRASLLQGIAAAQDAAGLEDQARQTMTEALVTARGMKDPDPVFGEIADDQTKKGRFAEAIATARGIKQPCDKARVICRIGTAQAESGLLEQASQTWSEAVDAARRIEASKWTPRFRPLESVAVAYPAKQVALEEIAAAQTKAGLAEEARKTSAEAAEVASQAENPSQAMGPRSEDRQDPAGLALSQSGQGRFAEALATARTIRQPDQMVWILHRIATEQVEAGQTDQARQTLR